MTCAQGHAAAVAPGPRTSESDNLGVARNPPHELAPQIAPEVAAERESELEIEIAAQTTRDEI